MKMKLSELTELEKNKLVDAYECARRGDELGKLRLLRELVCNDPTNPRLQERLGGAYWNFEVLAKAELHLKKATILDPSSENTSVALFHVLYDQGKVDEAFAEIRRYITDYEPHEYKLLLDEIENGLESD